MRSLRASLTLSVAFVCMLAGCASTESGIKPESTSEFTLGATTQQYVIWKLGTPSSTTTFPDGSTVLVYTGSFAAIGTRIGSEQLLTR